jgi:hypothetical protein
MKKTLLITLAAIGLSTPALRANWGIDWQNAYTGVPMIDSYGNPLTSAFTFQLGTFNTCFNPAANPYNTWQSNWKLLNVGNFVPNDPLFGPLVGGSLSFDATNGTVQGLAGSSTFSAGEQAYVWVRSATEAALFTDNSPGAEQDDIWLLPNTTDSLGRTLTWVTDNANTAVLGSINQPTFRLQTALVNVPEPTSAMLILLGGMALRVARGRARRQS